MRSDLDLLRKRAARVGLGLRAARDDDNVIFPNMRYVLTNAQDKWVAMAENLGNVDFILTHHYERSGTA